MSLETEIARLTDQVARLTTAIIEAHGLTAAPRIPALLTEEGESAPAAADAGAPAAAAPAANLKEKHESKKESVTKPVPAEKTAAKVEAPAESAKAELTKSAPKADLRVRLAAFAKAKTAEGMSLDDVKVAAWGTPGLKFLSATDAQKAQLEANLTAAGF